MSTYSSKDVAFILIDEFNVTGLQTDLSDNLEALLREVTAMGDTWPSAADTGLRRAEFATDGFYDGASGLINDALAGDLGISRIVSYTVEGNTLNKKMVTLSGAFVGKYTRTAKMGEFHRAKGDYAVSGIVDYTSRIVKPLAAVTTDGNSQSTPVDNAALSSGGGAGVIHVTALTLSTSTNLIVKLRHSVDNITYADLATFATITGVTAERVTFAGTVNRYIAYSRAWGGGAGVASSATFVVGIQRF